MQIKSFILAVIMLLSLGSLHSQNTLTQNIRGIITDNASGAPLAYVSVGLLDIPEIGVSSDEKGQFVLRNVPVGRHTLQATLVGYEPNVYREILVTSAKEVHLNISLKENIEELNEVVIQPQTNKDQPLNKMALSGARMLSVEEASRYAGAMDDPGRLVSSFAGVAAGVSNNGISIHGNAPHLLQWRLEDVEIPNPNHFADVSTLGGGILSSLSSNVLANSDFFTGAFPAEYNNAVSGIFDMRLRNGNNQTFEHTFKAGILGLDFASEGPISRKHNSSYIFNYRYSTTGLLQKLSDMDQKLDYQDLNFKFNFPTQKAGIFSVWGTAYIDKIKPEMDDVEDWKYNDDGKQSEAKQSMAAGGLSHRYFFGNNTQLKSTIAATYSKTDAWEDQHYVSIDPTPYLDFKSRYTNLIFNTSLNHKFNSRFTTKTGFTYTRMYYDMEVRLAPIDGLPLETISQGDGSTSLMAAYASTSIGLSDKVTMSLGVNGQLFTLNNEWTLEPRAAIKWQSSSRSSFALAYGMHSRMEKMDVYFVKTKVMGDELVNKDLAFTKAHHVSLSYAYKISDNMNLRIEPYFQYLCDIPVIADSSFSVLNRSNFYIEDALINKGKGRNIGVDITFERYLDRGLYYMITASVFNSRYCGGDGKWHNSRFNRNFIVNGLIGKEWAMGRSKQNILSVNLKLTLQGGDRYSPIDEPATLAHPDKEVQYDEHKAYSKQFSPIFLANYGVSYKMNKRKVAHEFAISGINATGYKEYYGHEYNIKTGVIEPRRNKTTIFNLSYKLDF